MDEAQFSKNVRLFYIIFIYTSHTLYTSFDDDFFVVFTLLIHLRFHFLEQTHTHALEVKYGNSHWE